VASAVVGSLWRKGFESEMGEPGVDANAARLLDRADRPAIMAAAAPA
jgi:hypothetical protein